MVMSFGQSHGAPTRATKTFDVTNLTHNTRSPEFLAKFQEIVDYGRSNPGAVIAIGCQQGKHRSVVLANKVSAALRTGVYHRDLGAK